MLLEIILITSGSIITVIGLTAFFFINRFLKNCIQTEGEVTDLKQNEEALYPVVKFRDSKGENFSFDSRIGSQHKYYKKQKVAVLYHKNNPQQAYIDHPLLRKLLPFTFIVTGSLTILITLIPRLL